MLAIQLISLGVIAAQGKRYFEELFHLGHDHLPAGPPGRGAVDDRGPEADRRATARAGTPSGRPAADAATGVRTPERSGN